MSLNLPSGERCFIDANILLHQLTNCPPFSASVEPFLRGVTAGEIKGFTSTIVLSEVLHKLMIAEVRALFPSAASPLKYLQRHPNAIGQLLVFPQATAKLARIGLQLLPVDMAEWSLAGRLAVQHSLFTNDACMIALMHTHQLVHLVTNDDDFDAIPTVTVHKPR